MSEERDLPVLSAPAEVAPEVSAVPVEPVPEPPRASMRRRRLAIALAVGLVAGAGYVGVHQVRSGQPPVTSTSPAPTITSTSPDVGAEAAVRRSAAGGSLLQRMASAILAGDQNSFSAALDPRAGDFGAQAQQVYDNFRTLPLASIVMRYVSDDPDALPLARRRALGGSEAWLAQVEVSWRLRDFDEQPVRLMVPVTMVTRDGTSYVASFTDQDTSRRPVWLLGTLRVQRGERSLVVSLDPNADLTVYAHQLDRAIEDVSKVLGRKWRRQVVFYLPRTERQMEYVLGAPAGTYARIAAVTTAEADERVAGVPVRIVGNPPVLNKAGLQGRRIVFTHETTHIAANATVSGVPLWLAEGFADYVAFKTVDVSTDAVAKDLFGLVRAGKGPKALADPASFAATASERRLAVAYAGSWLACRLIATDYGEPKLVRFYREVHSSSSPSALDDAFHDVLGTSQQQFVSDWQRYLKRLAND